MSTVGRHEVHVAAIGAEKAAAELRRVSAAEDGITTSAARAAKSQAALNETVEDASEWAIRQRIAVQDAEMAIARKVRAEQAARREMEALLNPTRETTKELGALSRAAGLAGSGLSVLRKAAEIIPGMELGTIFAAIAAGAYALYKAFDDGDAPIARQTAALQAQAAAARLLAQAQREVLASQVSAGASSAKRMLDRLGSGATPEAIDAAIRLGAQRDEAERAQGEAIQRMTRHAGGLVPVTDAEQRRIEALQAERNKLIAAAEERDGDPFNLRKGDGYKLSRVDRTLLGIQAKALQSEIDKIREQASAVPPVWMGARVQETTRALEDIDRQLNGVGIGDSGAGGGGGGGRGRGGGLSARERADKAWFARTEAEMAERQRAEAAQAAGVAAGVREFSKPAATGSMEPSGGGAASGPVDELGAAFDAAESRTRAYFELSNRLASEGKQMLLGFGQGFANAAAAALISGKGFRQTTNELVKALAAQALGRSLFEAAAAVASLAIGNVPAAALHGKAAAMFGAIAAGGIVGAAASGGIRGGAGGGASSAGGGEGFGQGRLSPAPPYQQTPASITVLIGGEEVHAVVVRENDRVIQSGSMSRPRFAA